MTPDPGELSDLDDWQEDEYMTRPRGILSPRERAHLAGWLEEDPKEDADAIRQREYRIRKHILNSIRDMVYLELNHRFREVLENEARAIVAGETGHSDQVPFIRTDIGGAVSSMIRSFYIALDSIQVEEGTTAFDAVLQDAIGERLVQSHAEEGESVIPKISLEIELGEKMSMDELETLYCNHDREEMIMLPQEMTALLDTKLISIEEYNEYVAGMRQMIEEEPERYHTMVDSALNRRGYEDTIYEKK